MNVLAADLGGTKTLFAILDCAGPRPKPLARQRLLCADYESFEAMFEHALTALATPLEQLEGIAIAVAGPITTREGHQHAQVTNLPWQLDGQALGRRYGQPVRLLNDFEAVALGVSALDSGDLHSLHPGTPLTQAPQGVIGAGTGLGQALRIWDGRAYRPLAAEGGHVDFAPTTASDQKLLDYLAEQFGHVSYERILSGPGLSHLYGFHGERPLQDPALPQAAQVSDLARAGDDAALSAMAQFSHILGAYAGNLALTTLAQGGIFIGGGVLPRILDLFDEEIFQAAFRAKGRMRGVLEQIPVDLITETEVGLLGAALAARAQPPG